MTALAPWVVDTDLTDERRLKDVDLPTGITLADLCAAATDELWRLSGCQYNARALNVRPHRLVSSCGCASPFALDGYGLYGLNAYGRFGPGWGGCDCDVGSSFELRYPATVTSVIVDGVALAENTGWILRDRNLLIRVGGGWPCCQDLSRPAGEAGTWSVAYILGSPPPALGVVAAREAVIAAALDLSNKPNRLPNRTESVQRQGTSVRMNLTPDKGKTGIAAVDRFLAAVNPHRLMRSPQCASPDTLVGAE